MAKKTTKTKAGRPPTERDRRHVAFDPDIAEKMDRIADKEERNFSNQINLALREWLKNRKK